MVTGVLDTDIVIDLLREHEPAENWLHEQNDLGVPIVVWYEVIRGTPTKRAMREASHLLRQFKLIELVSSDQQWALEQLTAFTHSHNVEVYDCLVAAVGQRLQVPVYTRNIKHFKPLIGDLAQKPY